MEGEGGERVRLSRVAGRSTARVSVMKSVGHSQPVHINPHPRTCFPIARPCVLVRIHRLCSEGLIVIDGTQLVLCPSAESGDPKVKSIAGYVFKSST